MQMTINLGETSLEKLKALVEWLEESPLDLNPLSLQADFNVKGVRVTMNAPNVKKVAGSGLTIKPKV